MLGRRPALGRASALVPYPADPTAHKPQHRDAAPRACLHHHCLLCHHLLPCPFPGTVPGGQLQRVSMPDLPPWPVKSHVRSLDSSGVLMLLGQGGSSVSKREVGAEGAVQSLPQTVPSSPGCGPPARSSFYLCQDLLSATCF